MPEPVVRLHGVRKQFGAREAVRDLAFELQAGETVGFVGPNGAGKSTVLRILIGLVFRDAGEVAVFGLDPDGGGVAIRRRCSYLPGETNVYPQMTGGEYLDFTLGFHARRNEELLATMQAAWSLPLAQRVRGYSAGMKQKLALLGCLGPDVDLYVLDEPDRTLDATARLQLREWVVGLRARHKTVLLSSHHLSEVEAIAQRLVFLIDGCVVPEARVRAARDQLRHEVRLRLAAGATPPPGARQDPDGSWRLRVPGEPLQFLAGLDPRILIAAEVGMTRLESLYQLLTETAEVRA